VPGYKWLKQGLANQPGGHLSASLSEPDGSEKQFEEFAANRSEFSTHEIISCVMVFIQVIGYYPRRANTIKFYGKMFTSEIDT